MSVDWITVFAQIGNFLVLLWLLKRFLYRPILDGIDAREAEISARMERAVLARETSKAVEEEYRNKLAALQSRQSELTDTQRQMAEAQADALLSQAHDRMERERQTWQAHLDEDGRKYSERLHRAGARALLSVTRKALADLADADLEACMARHLAKQAVSMAPEIRTAAGQGRSAVLSSREPLSAAAQAEFAGSFAAVVPEARLQFSTDPGQSPGVVLRVGGAQLAWTVDTYIDGLDAQFTEQLAVPRDPAGQGR